MMIILMMIIPMTIHHDHESFHNVDPHNNDLGHHNDLIDHQSDLLDHHLHHDDDNQWSWRERLGC